MTGNDSFDSTPLPTTISDGKAYAVIGTGSSAMIGFLLWLLYIHSATGIAPSWTHSLPTWNAVCNGLSSIFIFSAIVAIRRRRPRLHAGLISIALAFSVLFLLSYIAYHTYHGDTRFAGQGWLRPTYFVMLISHILLSMVMVPMILTTLFFALTGRWSRHRTVARCTFPLWMYVSLTGVALYFFLRTSV